MPQWWASCSHWPSAAVLCPRRMPRKRMASWRMTANSDDAALRTSTVVACGLVSSGRGLIQSAAAVSGESGRPVVGSRGSGVIGVARCFVSPRSSNALRRRHSATNRARCVWLCGTDPRQLWTKGHSQRLRPRRSNQGAAPPRRRSDRCCNRKLKLVQRSVGRRAAAICRSLQRPTG